MTEETSTDEAAVEVTESEAAAPTAEEAVNAETVTEEQPLKQ